MDSSSPPCFPTDLEREIVETAAYLHPETIPALLLVSHRVHEWIERIKYRTVTTDGKLSTLSFQSLLRAIRSNIKPPSFFAERVQHLFAGYRRVDDELAEVLSAWIGFRRNYGSDPMTLLPSLRPRRLYVHIRALLADLESPHLHPAFSLLTHLDVLDAFKNLHTSNLTFDWVIRELSLFPALTHLALYDCSASATAVLAKCTMLELLVDAPCDDPKSRHLYVADDLRFVSIALSDADYARDWIIGTQGGRDFWARGDMFVAKRRRGEIEPSSRYWIEDGDGI
ncbi:hypothetical protein C8R46DRAFT_1077865 [Mycena filopes]|nr:hypothetical protein C8R46DRAFT_1077865 [Mycena filopes]